MTLMALRALTLTATASAVSNIDIANGATTAGTTISRVGSDTDINIFLKPKGGGQVRVQPGTNSAALRILNSTGGSTAFAVDNSNLTMSRRVKVARATYSTDKCQTAPST
jgi:hypothetical protein